MGRWAEKRISILGAGRSGWAAARALDGRGARVFLSDARPLPAAMKARAERRGLAFEAGGHSARALEAELVVVSPGVPWDHPLVERARARAVPVWGELELGWRLCPSRRIVAVTGTNGKSTTTRLIGALLAAAGHQVAVGGNLGPPLCELLPQIDPATWVVLEVSSFQLEGACAFRPRVGVWLNLAPDHLDRHGTLARYRALKARLFARQAEGDHAVLGPGLSPPAGARAQLHRFRPLPASGPWRGLPRHLREDLAAARLAARLADPRCSLKGIDWGTILSRRAHCLEPVGRWGKVRFVNDSKATNPHATRAALEALQAQGPLAVILGGCPKGADPAPLAAYLAAQPGVVQAILVGPFAPHWQAALRAAGCGGEVTVVEDLNAALRALRPAVRTCVLSPAGASFDQFPHYRARGQAFRAAVAQFIDEQRQIGANGP